jgi:hypothetical protein
MEFTGNTMRMTVPFVLFLLVLFAIALGCLFFPKTVQSVAIRAVQLGVTSRSQALVAFVSSRQYIFAVRAVGLVALVAAVFLSTASLRNG